MKKHEDLFIPQYEEIYKAVLSAYQDDFRVAGLQSYEYKVASGRVQIEK